MGPWRQSSREVVKTRQQTWVPKFYRSEFWFEFRFFPWISMTWKRSDVELEIDSAVALQTIFHVLFHSSASFSTKIQFYLQRAMSWNRNKLFFPSTLRRYEASYRRLCWFPSNPVDTFSTERINCGRVIKSLIRTTNRYCSRRQSTLSCVHKKRITIEPSSGESR